MNINELGREKKNDSVFVTDTQQLDII